jgi:hypothetical protein
MWYQNAQLKELNPMMNHTWGWGSGTIPTTKRLALPIKQLSFKGPFDLHIFCREIMYINYQNFKKSSFLLV